MPPKLTVELRLHGKKSSKEDVQSCVLDAPTFSLLTESLSLFFSKSLDDIIDKFESFSESFICTHETDVKLQISMDIK
jgi:hypothetical protein